ncbi:MAG: bifunctional NUDIX hydrolase family protein/GNAT family N-acetyltransferase [Ilumatobacteraceae bacterium]
MDPDGDELQQEWRTTIRAAVAARRAVDARERDAIAEFLTELDRLERPFDEHADRVHVTASAIVVGPRGVVLHRHKRLGLWLQPGGHIDPGEAPWDAARREAEEETGLPVSFAESPQFPHDGSPQLVHVDVHAGPRKHRHLDLRYVLTSPHVAPAPPAGESQDVEWFQWHRAVAIAEPGLEGVLRALQPGHPVIRAARSGDARECADVYLRSRAFALADVPLVHEEQEVRRWMGDELIGHLDVTVAELDGTIVGLMALDVGPRGGLAWIDQLYLDPAWMGRGLGERFVTLAEQRHPTGLQLWTFAVNTAAQRFYERLGFTAVERTDGAGNEERAPDIRYEWRP